MIFIDDERGVQPVIGAILVFALLVLLLGILQTYAVPNQTEAVEFNHNQDVQADMAAVEAAISQTATLGGELTTPVDLGTQFPARFILLSPPAATGTLRTETAGNVTLSNAVASHSGETGDFFDGTEKNYTAQRLVYTPSYNRYSEAPETVIESGVAYDQHDDRILPQRESLVDGTRINLVIVDGDLSETGLSTKVRTEPLSAPTETVAVTNASGEHVNITLATRLNASQWEEALEADIDGGYVEAVVDAGPNRVTVVMEQGRTYKLRMAKVGVSPSATDPEPAYMTDESGNGAAISEGGTQELTVQVRDEYSNPVVGETVQFEIDDFDSRVEDGYLLEGADDEVVEVRTDERGLASVTYKAPPEVDSNPDTFTIESTYDPSGYDDPSDPDDVALKVRVLNGSQESEPAALFNPPEGDGIIFVSATEANFNCPGQGNIQCETNVEFKNTAGSTISVESARFLFYGSDSQGSAGVDDHNEVRIIGIGEGVDGDAELERNKNRTDIDLSFNDSEEKTLEFRFYDTSGDPSTVQAPDWFVISFFVDGERSTYFIQVAEP